MPKNFNINDLYDILFGKFILNMNKGTVIEQRVWNMESEHNIQCISSYKMFLIKPQLLTLHNLTIITCTNPLRPVRKVNKHKIGNNVNFYSFLSKSSRPI